MLKWARQKFGGEYKRWHVLRGEMESACGRVRMNPARMQTAVLPESGRVCKFCLTSLADPKLVEQNSVTLREKEIKGTEEMVRLGEKVTDSLTGFTGVATARAEFLYGGIRVCVEPVDGRPREPQWFDEQRLAYMKSSDPLDLPVRQAIEEVLRKGRALTPREIAEEAQLDWSDCCRALNYMMVEGQVEPVDGKYKMVSRSLIIVLPVECQTCGGPLVYAESVERSHGQTHLYRCPQGHEVTFDSGDE